MGYCESRDAGCGGVHGVRTFSERWVRVLYSALTAHLLYFAAIGAPGITVLGRIHDFGPEF